MRSCKVVLCRCNVWWWWKLHCSSSGNGVEGKKHATQVEGQRTPQRSHASKMSTCKVGARR